MCGTQSKAIGYNSNAHGMKESIPLASVRASLTHCLLAGTVAGRAKMDTRTWLTPNAHLARTAKLS